MAKSTKLPLTHPLKAQLYNKLALEREYREKIRREFGPPAGYSPGVYAEMNFADYGIESIEDLIDLAENSQE